MSQSIISQQEQMQLKPFDETILVVKRLHFFKGDVAWQGLRKVDFNHYLHIIDHKKEFHPRSIMEKDLVYKQIIPYLVFMHKDKIFLMQRQSTASEHCLRNKFTRGSGGHIRKEDMIDHSLFSWARREFYEEVSYVGEYTIESLGIINDDSSDVGKVHIGFVLLLKGNTDAIAVKSELKSGRLVSFDECLQQRDSMESWSQLVIDELARTKV